jgi:hypothetical protein
MILAMLVVPAFQHLAPMLFGLGHDPVKLFPLPTTTSKFLSTKPDQYEQLQPASWGAARGDIPVSQFKWEL